MKYFLSVMGENKKAQTMSCAVKDCRSLRQSVYRRKTDYFRMSGDTHTVTQRHATG